MIFRSRYSIGKVANSKRGSRRSAGAKHQAKKNRSKWIEKFSKKLFYYGGIFFGGGFIFAVILFYIGSLGLPDVDQIQNYVPNETTKIYSEDNVVLAQLHLEENRVPIDLNDISPSVLKAVVAMEDSNFYSHHGVDVFGIFRAFFVNMAAGSFVEGASTITQQLARNIFLHRKKKLFRKVQEAILAVKIERRYTKTEILELYLNQVYWGHNAYGIESAAILYFGKPAKELTLGESAMLVGLLSGPELYSPIKNFSRAKKRQRLVLDRMRQLNIIDQETFVQAYNQEIKVRPRSASKHLAPYFTQYIIAKLIGMYGEEATYTGGLKVYTTLNYRMQAKAEAVVNQWVEYGHNPNFVQGSQVSSLNYGQAAILAIDPRNGYIKAMQGGHDFINNQYNRTIQSKRQPGSAFKPFLYLAALEKGFSPGSFVDDTPVTFSTFQGPYSPKNYTDTFMGRITLKKALENSINVVAIKLNALMGPQAMVSVARRVGIKSPLQPILSLPLGSNEVNMLELVSAYGVFANDGIRVEPSGIIRIEDREGNVLYENKATGERVFDSNIIAALVDMLRGVITDGTGKAANLPRPVAGKTGTTSDYRDAWFIGFVPQLVCGTWVGNDNNTPTNRITGGSVPAMMWKDFMIEALKGMPPQQFTHVEDMVTIPVDWESGKPADANTPPERVTQEQYWKGTQPDKVAEPDNATNSGGKPAQSNEAIIDTFHSN